MNTPDSSWNNRNRPTQNDLLTLAHQTIQAFSSVIGLSVAITKPNCGTFTYAVGHANIDQQYPLTDNTRMSLASQAKPVILSIALMRDVLKKLLVYTFFFLFFMPAFSESTDTPGMICGHENNVQIYQKLNYGLYWFADVNNQAYCKPTNQDSRFFSFTKPHTLIFVHGWSPYSVKNHKRFDFNALDIFGPHVTDMIAPWLKGSSGDHKAWNMGVFYWNQFADEFPNKTDSPTLMTSVQKAEEKIWSANGPIQMRWRDANDQLLTVPKNLANKNIAQLFYEQYITALKDYKGDVRLVGASLGTQIIISVASMIDDQVQAGYLPKNLLPKQLVLLDPVVTDIDNSIHMKTLIADVKQLEHDGVIISGYRTSILGDTLRHTDDNSELLKYTAFSQIDPCVYSQTALMQRHTAGIWWYFLSYNLKAVPLSHSNRWSAPFANLPDSELRVLMNPDAPGFKSDFYRNAFMNHQCHAADIDHEWYKWEMKELKKQDI